MTSNTARRLASAVIAAAAIALAACSSPTGPSQNDGNSSQTQQLCGTYGGSSTC